MRHDTAKSIGTPAETALTTPDPGQGDFLSRVNTTIANFKELAKIFAQLKPQQAADPQDPPPGPGDKVPAVNPAARVLGPVDYMQMAIQAGYGDVAIGKLIEQISPHTIKQVMEIFKNVGPKK